MANVQCPHCNGVLQLAGHAAGAKVRCPLCNGVFAVTPAMPKSHEQIRGGRPAPAKTQPAKPRPAPPERVDDPEPASIRRHDVQEKPFSPGMIIGLVVGVAAIVVLLSGGALFYFMARGRQVAVPVAVAPPAPPVVQNKVGADAVAKEAGAPDAAPVKQPVQPAPAVVQPKPDDQAPPQQKQPTLLKPVVVGKKTTIPLPAAATDMVAGGDGRFLIALVPSIPAAAIVDVKAQKISHQIPLKSDKVLLTANLEHLIVVDPEAKTLERWGLESGKLEASGPTPGPDVRLAAMGAASRGPLLLHPGNTLGGKRPFLVDPATLKEGPWKAVDEGMKFLHGGEQLRASPDGQFFGFWSPHTTPQKQSYLVVQGDTLKTRWGWHTAGHVTPNVDGSIVYTGNGKFGPNNEPLPGHGKGANYLLPAQQGPFYLKIDEKHVLLFHEDGDQQLANLADVPLPQGINAWDRERFGNDRRVWLIPKHQLIVTLPDDKQVVLYAVRPYQLLAAAKIDYLDVAVGVPAEFPERGKAWTHPITARSSKEGVTYKLELAPKGMEIAADGTLRWPTPSDFPESNAPVTVVVAGAGKEVRRQFVLPVRGELPKAVAFAPKKDDPPAKGGAALAGWTTVTAKDKSYSLQMPAGVKHAADGIEADAGDGTHVEIKLMPSPKLKDSAVRPFLKAMVDMFGESARNVKEGTTGPHPSLSLEMVKGPVTVYMRMIVAGGKVYQMVYIPPMATAAHATNATVFFDSFRTAGAPSDAPAVDTKVAGPAPKLTWKTHTFAKAAFQVDFPAEPTAKLGNILSGKHVDVTATAGELTFHAHMEDDFIPDTKLIMSKHDGHLRGAKRRDFEFLGSPASDLEGPVGKQDRYQYFRIIVKNTRVYFLSVEGPKGKVHPATAQEFFTSLKLLERPSLNLPAADPKITLENLTEHPVSPSFGIPDIAFSPKGDLLAITTQCGLVHLWEYPAMKSVAQLAAAKKTGATVANTIQKAAFSPDGKLLAVAGGEDYTIKLFDVAGRKEKGFLIVGQFVYSLAFLPDGKHLAVARSDNPMILIWNVDTKKQVDQWKFFDDSQPRALAASPDGKTIASGGMRSRVLCWDVAAKNPYRHFSTQDFQGVTSLSFRSDGNLLAFGSEDKRVRIMNVMEAGILYTLDGHAGDVLTVAFAPDGKSVASGGRDKTLRFWSMAKGAEIHTELLGDTVQSVVFSPDGSALLAATRDGTISKWSFRSK